MTVFDYVLWGAQLLYYLAAFTWFVYLLGRRLRWWGRKTKP